MLQATIEASVFGNILDSLEELIEISNWTCTSECMTLMSMDKPHVALVSVQLLAKSFVSYRCDRPITLAVRTSDLLKVAHLADKEDLLSIRANEDEDVVTLVYKPNEREPRRISQANLHLLDTDVQLFTLPDTEYGMSVILCAKEFKRIVTTFESLDADTLNLECSNGSLKLIAGGKTTTGSMTLKDTRHKVAQDPEKRVSKRISLTESVAGVTIEIAEEDTSLTVSLKYLLKMVKAHSLSAEVQLMICNDTPLLLMYEFGDAYLRYYLAPAVD